MLARFSIYAEVWRNQCNIELETTTDLKTKQKMIQKDQNSQSCSKIEPCGFHPTIFFVLVTAHL